MNIDDILKIELEITSDCNAACPGCARTQNPDILEIRSFTIDYHTWSDTDFTSNDKCIKMEYTHIPLLPAWAITIHKSQGMTLNSCVTSTDHIFETGQFYVAISRVKTLNGLFLTAYNPNKIKVNKKIDTNTFK